MRRFMTILGLGIMAPLGESSGGGGAPAVPAPLAGNEGQPAPLPPGDPDPVDPPAPAEPFAVFNDKEAFNKRLKQHTRSELKSIFGTDDKDAIAAQWTEYQALKAGEEERKRAEMTEIERYKADVAKERAEKEAALEEAKNIKFENMVSKECASRGIKNIDYALYAVTRQASGLPEGEQLDVGAYLDERLQDEKAKRAFDVDEAPIVQGTPITSTPTGDGSPPPAPPAGGNPTPQDDVMTMDPVKFRERLARLGVGSPGT